MAHKKAGGSTSLGRDSRAKRLGIKLFAGEHVKPGMIIVRQRGTKYYPGKNVRKGKDDTLFATATGVVRFKRTLKRRFNGALAEQRIISVV